MQDEAKDICQRRHNDDRHIYFSSKFNQKKTCMQDAITIAHVEGGNNKD